MTVSQAVNDIRLRLKSKNIASADIDSQLIVAKAINTTRVFVLTHSERELTNSEIESVESMTDLRLENMPMQYILGKCEFMGLDFEVTKDTLIPRGDTEVLVETALDIIKKEGYTSAIDIGTGSGAIAVSIAKYIDISVTAVDISRQALSIAIKNAKNNNVNLQFVESDLFSEVNNKFDIVISNPPYIESSVIPSLEPNVKDYEPMLALDGGEDGLYFYKKIINECHEYINNNGSIAFEIGYNQGKAVSKLLTEKGFCDVKVIKDLAGLDRVVVGKFINGGTTQCLND